MGIIWGFGVLGSEFRAWGVQPKKILGYLPPKQRWNPTKPASERTVISLPLLRLHAIFGGATLNPNP